MLGSNCAEAYDSVQRNDYDRLETLRRRLEKQAKRMSLCTAYRIPPAGHIRHIVCVPQLSRIEFLQHLNGKIL